MTIILALVPLGANARISIDDAQYVELNEVLFLNENGQEIHTISSGEITPLAYVSNKSYMSYPLIFIEAVYSGCELTYIHLSEQYVSPGHTSVPLEKVNLTKNSDKFKIMLWDTLEHGFPVSEEVSLSHINCNKSVSDVYLKYEDTIITGFVNRLEKTITFASCPGFTVPMDVRHPLSQKLSSVGCWQDIEIIFETEDENCVISGTEFSQDIYSGQAFYTITSPDGSHVRYRAQVMKTTDNAPVFFVDKGDFENSEEIVPVMGSASVYRGDYDKVCTVSDPDDKTNRVKYTKKFLLGRETRVGLYNYYPYGGTFETSVRFRVDDITSDAGQPFMRLAIGEDGETKENMTGSPDGIRFINIDYDTYCLGIDRNGNAKEEFSDYTMASVLDAGKWYTMRILIFDAGDYIKSEIYIDGKYFTQQKKEKTTTCNIRNFFFSGYSDGEFTLYTDDYYIAKLEDKPKFAITSEFISDPMTLDFETPFDFNSEVNKLYIGYESQNQYGTFSVETDPMDIENTLLKFEKQESGGNNTLRIGIPSMKQDTTGYSVQFDIRFSEMNYSDDAVMYWHLASGVKGYFYRNGDSQVGMYIHNGTNFEYVNSFAFEPAYMNTVKIVASKESGPDSNLNYARYDFYINNRFCDSVMCESANVLTNGTELMSMYGASSRTFVAYIDNIQCTVTEEPNNTHSAYFDSNFSFNKVNDGLCICYDTVNEYGDFYISPDNTDSDNFVLVLDKRETGNNNSLKFVIPDFNSGTDRYSIEFDLEFESMNLYEDAVLYFRLGNTTQGYFFRGESGNITMHIYNGQKYEKVSGFELEPYGRHKLKFEAEITSGNDNTYNYYKYSFYKDNLSATCGSVTTMSKDSFVSGTEVFTVYGATSRIVKAYMDNVKINFE